MPILLGPSKEKTLPIVAIREGVVFPHTETVLSFGRPASVAAVEAAFKGDSLVAFFSQKNPRLSEPGKDDLYQIGTLGKVERVLRTETETHAWVKGLSRTKLESIDATTPFLVGKVIDVPEIVENSDEVSALSSNLVKSFQTALNLGKSVDVMTVMRLMGQNSPPELADQISYVMELKTSDKQKLLETLSVSNSFCLSEVLSSMT